MLTKLHVYGGLTLILIYQLIALIFEGSFSNTTVYRVLVIIFAGFGLFVSMSLNFTSEVRQDVSDELNLIKREISKERQLRITDYYDPHED